MRDGRIFEAVQRAISKQSLSLQIVGEPIEAKPNSITRTGAPCWELDAIEDCMLSAYRTEMTAGVE